MSGFLQRLALRGAGLAGQAGVAPLRVRPRGRFEPAAAAAGPTEERVDVPAAVRTPPDAAAAPAPALAPAPAIETSPAPRPRARRRPPAAPRAEADGTTASIASAPARRAAARVEPAAAAPIEEAEGSPDPAGAPREALATEPTRVLRSAPLVPENEKAAPRATADAGGEPADPAEMAEMAEPAEASETVEATPDSAAAPAPDLAGSAIVERRRRTEPPPGEIDRARAAELPAAVFPHRPAAGEDGAPPSFSLSIGRIDVEFVHPPAAVAAAPPAARADARTRGFDRYSRIRRGSPR